MKLKDVRSTIQILNDYFNTEEKLNFEVAEKLCDLMPELEDQNFKYDKLNSKFLKDYYNPKQEENGNITYVAKDITQLDVMISEKSKIDSIEWIREKQVMPKPKEIPVKVLLALKKFFIFE